MIPGVIEPQDEGRETAITAPKEVRDRVTLGQPEAWVQVREDYFRVVRRLETRQALQELGQWRLNFDPRTHHVVVHSIRVRREGVAVEHASAEQFRFLQREGGLDSQVIDGWITLMVLLEDVRVGDVIDASYTIHSMRKLLRDRSWLFTTVPLQAALRVFHLTVRFAGGRAMQWNSNEKEFAPAIKEEGGETVWSWTKENLQPAELEPNVPAWHFPGTWVQVTDCASWGEIAAGLAAVWREEMDAPELLRMVEEINAAAATPLEQIDRAVTMVQDDIRYLSVNEDLGGQIPSSPGAVLRRRYGDCKDKSFLLSHLLHLLGVKAWPVLVHTHLRQSVEELLPAPDAFNHVIVKYEVDGQTRWVDATLSLQGGGALARLVPDFRAGLPVGPGIAGLEKIPPLPVKNERYELREAFSLDSRPGHPSIMNVSIRACGWQAENLRRGFANVGDAGMARSREQFYRRLFPELQRAGELKWEDNRGRNEFRLSESYDIENAVKLTPDGSACVFYYQTHYIQWMLGIAQGGKRRHPYLLTFPCNVEHTVEVETTGLLNEKTMLPVIEQGITFRFSCDQKRKANRGVMTYNLKTLTGVITPQQFETHKKMVDKIWPATTFYFRFPRGLPAPQRRPAGAKKIAPPGTMEISRERAPVRKVKLLSEAERRGSRRKKRTKGQSRQAAKWEGISSKHKILIGLGIILVIGSMWLLWLFFMVKG